MKDLALHVLVISDWFY